MSFLSCEEMLAAARSQNLSLSEAILRSDLAESRLTEEHSRESMRHLWQVMQRTACRALRQWCEHEGRSYFGFA